MKTQFPAGLVDGNIEFFDHNNGLNFLSNGSVRRIPRLSDEAREIALKDMLSNKRAYEKICAWGYSADEKLYKYISCRCGGFDNVADIDIESKKLNSEYWNCPMRSFCNGSGVVCILPSGPNGKLTHQELKAIHAIKDGSPMKVACERMGVKFNTLRAYLKSSYKKMGVHSNVALLQFARTNNII